MNTEITGNFSNRPARRQHDIDGTILEVLIELTTFL